MKIETVIIMSVCGIDQNPWNCKGYRWEVPTKGLQTHAYPDLSVPSNMSSGCFVLNYHHAFADQLTTTFATLPQPGQPIGYIACIVVAPR